MGFCYEEEEEEKKKKKKKDEEEEKEEKKKEEKEEKKKKKKKKKKILVGGGCDTYEEVIHGRNRDWLQTPLQAGFILHNGTHNNTDLVAV
jgi:hypothetical protein